MYPRTEVLQRDFYVCQECGALGAEVHHIVSRGRWKHKPEMVHRQENLITLCLDHHRIAASRKKRYLHLRILQRKYGYEYPDEPWAGILREGAFMNWEER